MTSPRDYALTPEQMGSPLQNILRALSKAPQMHQEHQMRNEALQKAIFENMTKKPEAETAQEHNKFKLLHERNAARLLGEQGQYYGPNIESEIASRTAMTNRTNKMLPGELEAQRIENKYAPQTAEANILYKKLMGQGRGGVDQQDLRKLGMQLQKEHPDWNENKLDEAISAYMAGTNKLSNGEELPVPSGQVDHFLNTLAGRESTAANRTQGIRSNQAEIENQVLGKYIQEGLAPYGDTILNKSPDQIIDSFKSDKESQIKLGKLIAAQALQFEQAQLRIKMAGGTPSLGQTRELEKMSGQMIDLKTPRLSSIARQEANKQIDKALNEGVEARNKYGIKNRSATGRNSSAEKLAGSMNQPKELTYNLETGRFE